MTTGGMRRIEVGGERPYAIHVGPGLLQDGAALAAQVRGRHALLVSDGNVAPLYAGRVAGALAAHGVARPLQSVVAPGEARYIRRARCSPTPQPCARCPTASCAPAWPKW